MGLRFQKILMQTFLGNFLYFSIILLKRLSIGSNPQRNIASIAEREMPSENWEEPEVQLVFPEPQEAAVRLPLMRSA